MENELTNAEVTILVKSSVENDEKELLPIIKECLERDFVFRTLFANRKVILDYEKIEDASENKKA